VTCAKVAFAALLVGALFYAEVISWRDLAAIAADPRTSLAPLGLLAVAFVLGGVRWYILLKALGVLLPVRAVLEIYAIGTFASVFLPGGVGGDIVRATYVMRAVRDHRSAGLVSIMFDRLSGLIGLLAVTSALIALNWAQIAEHPAILLISVSAVLLLAALVIPSVAILVVAGPLQRLELLASWNEAGGLRRHVVRLVAALVTIRGRSGSLALACLLSVALSSLTISSIVLLASHFALLLSPLAVATAAGLAVLATAVPITPGGIGVGEAAFAYLCGLWDLGQAPVAYGTVFFGYRLASMLLALASGTAFVTYTKPVQT